MNIESRAGWAGIMALADRSRLRWHIRPTDYSSTMGARSFHFHFIATCSKRHVHRPTSRCVAVLPILARDEAGTRRRSAPANDSVFGPQLETVTVARLYFLCLACSVVSQ